jgi:hypothetical protein
MADFVRIEYNLKTAGFVAYAGQTLSLKLVDASANAAGNHLIGRSTITSTSATDGTGAFAQVWVNGNSDIGSQYDLILPESEHIRLILPSSSSGTIQLADLVANNQPSGDATAQQASLFDAAVQRANHTGTQALSTISDAGTIASQNSNSVSISGGSISGVAISGSMDLNGSELILDADADTSITADTDDRIDIKIAGTDQLQFTDGAILPVTDNDIDLGSASKGFKNLHADGSTIVGTISASSLSASSITVSSGGFSTVTAGSADIDGGTIDGVTIGTSSAATDVRVDNLKLDGNAITSTDTDGNIDLTPDGTGEVNISKVDINGGAIDGTVIGASSAAAGTFASISVSDGDITNAGDINCDEISVDASANGLNVNFNGNTGTNKISLSDNVANALDITESSNSYIKFVTSNSSEEIIFGQDASFTANKLTAGSGFTGTGTLHKSSVIRHGDIIITRIFVDLTDLLSTSGAGNVIGGNNSNPSHIGQITAAKNGTIFHASMICTEAPTTGDADINLHAVGDSAIAKGSSAGGSTVLNGGTQSRNTETLPSGTLPTANQYLYLAQGGTTAGTYDAGQLLIELHGFA